MVEEEKKSTGLNNESMFNQTWVNALIDAEVFEGDPINWKITENNYI